MKNLLKSILILFTCFAFCSTVFAETKVIEGKVSTQQPEKKTIQTDLKKTEKPKIIKSSISTDVHTCVDVQVLKTAIYYHPDADISYQLLKAKAQWGHPHIVSYKEIDGLYRTALADSEFQEELKEWKFNGGPSPYYINAGTEIRNNGDGAITDVKLTFTFEVKVAPLRTHHKTLVTDYKDLHHYARWRKWKTVNIPVKIIPPGEYMEIHTPDISLTNLLGKLKNQWPAKLRVKVNAYSTMDSRKNNNYATKTIKMIPDHFVLKALH